MNLCQAAASPFCYGRGRYRLCSVASYCMSRGECTGRKFWVVHMTMWNVCQWIHFKATITMDWIICVATYICVELRPWFWIEQHLCSKEPASLTGNHTGCDAHRADEQVQVTWYLPLEVYRPLLSSEKLPLVVANSPDRIKSLFCKLARANLIWLFQWHHSLPIRKYINRIWPNAASCKP